MSVKAIMQQIQDSNEKYKHHDKSDIENTGISQCKRFLINILKVDFDQPKSGSTLKTDIYAFLEYLNK